ncbi:DUF2897 family protein [Thalassotalea litorea]|uniref:DUF2897 family protein n=1 Tax=Thalassotalea litorea TaxID=2020715 RepID=A0A5R9ILP3_9GAMM|nr:DUF2897 family protein [Thalassotalea litorea]TLU64171.1 DUF2897 family protein [Thalassotalea litorea]
MSIGSLLIIIAILGFIVGGVYFLFKSARKFNLSDEQKQRIDERNKALDKEEQAEQED